MNLGHQVLCNPHLPEDWAEREAHLALEAQTERAGREESHVDPDVLWLFRRAAAPDGGDK